MSASALGLAARALQRLPRERVQLIVIGQSNEHGNVAVTDRGTYPTAFQSVRNPGVTVPLGPAISRLGGWWPAVYDTMWDWGYDLDIVNAAIGGISFPTQTCGLLQGWQANYTYNSVRAPTTYSDRGDFGDLLMVGSRVFQCIAGGYVRTAYNRAPTSSASGVVGAQDIMNWGGGGASGATQPDFANAGLAIGATVADGALTWRRLDESQYSGTNVYSPDAIALNGMMMPARIARGFDPLGVLDRALEEAQRRPAARRIVYIANGQADLGYGTPSYGSALMAIGTFFLQRGCEVMPGLTMHAPGLAIGTSANYAKLAAGVTDAITALSGAFPGKVWAGANLYTAMGATGPMGGGRLTGSIAGSTLTVTAVGSGAIEVGHNIWSGQTLVGTVSALGTGTGGVGTYALDTAIVTGASALIAAGAMFQYDGVHVMGRGAVGPAIGGVQPASSHIATALKTPLPRIVR